jgi:hypothetical protein
MKVNKKRVFKRLQEYNPDISNTKLVMFCALFEHLITKDGFEMADSSTKDDWTEQDAKASWSVECEAECAEMEGIDIEEEICNMLIYELAKDIPKGTKLGYLKFTRAISEKTFSPRMKVSFGGLINE